MIDRRLADLVRVEIARTGISVVEEAVFGTDDPDMIASTIEQFCETQLSGKIPVRPLFYRVTVGCTFGLELDSGECVVMKAYQPRWTRDFLAATKRVQRRVADGGFPAPRVWGVPSRPPASPGLVTVEEFLPDPGMRPFINSAELHVSSTALALLIDMARDLSRDGLDQSPHRQNAAALFPVPHSPVFDFDGTAEGAEWIDRFAVQAKSTMAEEHEPPVITHADWSARNIRIASDRLVAAYDWDSVAAMTEATAVGQAAITWRTTAEGGDGPFPDPDELDAYYEAYEAAARHTIDRRATRAASLYLLAYIARCEHSLTVRRIPYDTPATARERLGTDGWRFIG